MTYEFILIFFLPSDSLRHPAEVGEWVGDWVRALVLASVNPPWILSRLFLFLLPLIVLEDFVESSVFSRPNALHIWIKEVNISWFLFISDVDGNSSTGEADSHLLIQALGLNPEQQKAGRIPLFYTASELNVHFLHILMHAESDHTWSCDMNMFIEGKK